MKGKTKEKTNNMVLFDQATYDKILTEAPKFKLVTPSILSDRLRSVEAEQSRTSKDPISVIPIFAYMIIFNTILAQLQTFSVQQGSKMNTRLFTENLHIPPASLKSIPYIMLMFIIPLYNNFAVPLATKFTGHESVIAPLHCIGFGLFIATFSLVAAAMLKNKRRHEAVHSGNIISIFWITPQFLIFGLSEMFTAVGLIEFFLQTVSERNAVVSDSNEILFPLIRFDLSSVLVSTVNKITGSSSGGGGWLSDNDLNKGRLDLFYWLLAALSFLNFFN